MTLHFGFGLDVVTLKVKCIVAKMQRYNKRGKGGGEGEGEDNMGVMEEKDGKDNEEVEKGRLRGGQDVLGCDAILSWSRALTHPSDGGHLGFHTLKWIWIS